MDDKFDKELMEMARESKVNEPKEIKELAKIVIHREKRNKRYKKQLAIASVMMICILSFLGVVDVVANEGHAIKSILEIFTAKTNKIDNEYNDNTVNHDYAVDSEEYSISIESTYYDGEKLELFYKITSINELDKSKIYYPNTILDVNADIDAIGGLEEIEFVDKNTFVGMISYGIAANSSEVWPEVLEGTIKINEIIVYGKDDTEERITIDDIPLKIKLDSNYVEVEEVNIKQTIYYEGLNSELTKLIRTPTGIILEELRDSSWLADTGYYFDTFIWDSQKGALKCRNKTTEKVDENIILKREFEKPKEASELAIITFVQKTGPIGDGSNRCEIYTVEEGLSLNLENLGEVYVEKVEYREDETLLTVRTTGYMSLQNLNILNGNNSILPLSIIDKEVLGELEMRATYVYPQVNKDLGVDISIFIPEYLKKLNDQVINISFK